MSTIELFDPTAHPDGWHDVRAPGGYEWWYFDAEDAASDTQLVAIFMHAFVFHPGYLRDYRRYRRRPTRTPPPIAAEHPSVYLCVYRDGRVWQQFFTEYRSDQSVASRDRAELSIGPNRLTRDGDDYVLSLAGTPWTLTSRGPKTHIGRSLSAELRFTPHATHGPIERTFLSPEMARGATHRWTIAAASNRVRALVRFDEQAIQFDGRGYHDHNFGTAPIGDGLARWTWGRAMFGRDRVVTFHHAEPGDRSRPNETHLVECDPANLVDHAVDRVTLGPERSCKPAMLLRYPSSIDFGDALRLIEPEVIDPSPFYLRLRYAAESFGERSTAFCEIAYPHRVRWPILGRMIAMSFDRRQRRPGAATV